MGKIEIISTIREYHAEMRSRYGVKKMGLFGSYARGTQKKRSDIDILVSFDREIDLFDFLDLREYLEDKLQAKVDLVMETALKPNIGKNILAQVEYV
jgi:hypothetical protein